MIKLHPLCTDNAVFQREKLFFVWGWTEPKTIVECELGGIRACAGSGWDGAFKISLPPMPAGGPYTLTVRNTKSGESVTAANVLIGEVFLASGQSNMSMTLGATGPQSDDFIAANADGQTIREFTVDRYAKSAEEVTCGGSWQISDRLHARTFSAAAIWFALRIREKLGVPVGIVNSSWGGTAIEAWTSKNTLRKNEAMRDILETQEKRFRNPDVWAKINMEIAEAFDHTAFLETFCKRDGENRGYKEGWANPDYDDSSWDNTFALPGDWVASHRANNGSIWIRQTVEIPENWAGKELRLVSGPIDKHDISYFNGVEVGRTGSGFDESFWCVPRCYTVPGGLVKPGRCVIAIRAFSFIYNGGFLGTVSDYYLERADNGERIPFGGPCLFKVEKDNGLAIETPNYTAMLGPDSQNACANLFNSMIRPLLNCQFRGAIWYQGENNSQSVTASMAYRRLMSDLIKDWRFWFDQGDFPFVQVELAAYRDPAVYNDKNTWPYLRNSQRLAAVDAGNAGLISALDAGDEKDIHPKNKRVVGERLADWMLNHAFALASGGGIGPEVREVLCEEGQLRIRFDHAENLHTTDGKAPALFYIAGMDKFFYPAEAEIVSGGVLLKSAKVPTPRHVRYAWADNPQGINLVNGDGLPTVTFEV